MILSCPNCSTRYLVNPGSIGADGRHVRCANCQHSWFEAGAMPEALAAVADIPEHEPNPVMFPIPEGSGLPVLVEPSRSSTGLIAATVLLFILTATTALVFHQNALLQHVPFLSAVYAPLGMSDSSGLKIGDIKVEAQDAGKRKRYQIHCSVINESKETRKAPMMRMTPMSPKGEAFDSNTDILPLGTVLKPGETLPCKSFQLMVDAKAEQVETLQLDLGNSWELMWRK